MEKLQALVGEQEHSRQLLAMTSLCIALYKKSPGRENDIARFLEICYDIRKS